MKDILLYLVKETDQSAAYEFGLQVGHFIADYGIYLAALLLIAAISVVMLVNKNRKKNNA
ncbi:MAG: hypothetical protein WA951_07345 [Leeuwenhoekiella sp.]